VVPKITESSLNTPFSKQIQPGWIFTWESVVGKPVFFITLSKPRTTYGGIWKDVTVRDLNTGQVFEHWPAENLKEKRLVSKLGQK